MGLPIFIRAFQKIKRVLDCHIFKSNLFNSDIVDGKNEYLKISVLLQNIATPLGTEWVLYMWLLSTPKRSDF